MTRRDDITDAELECQLRAAEEVMHRYRHALRALATGQTVEEAKEEMAREEAEAARKRHGEQP